MKLKKKISTENKYDIVLIIALLHHLDDSESDKLMNFVKHCLKPGGKVYSLDGVFHENQSFLSKFILSKDRGKYVRTVKGYRDIVAPYFSNVKINILSGLLRIPTDIIVMTME